MGAGPLWEEPLTGTAVGWGTFPLDLQFLGKQASGQQPREPKESSQARHVA